jgi:hypothetical protein
MRFASFSPRGLSAPGEIGSREGGGSSGLRSFFVSDADCRPGSQSPLRIVVQSIYADRTWLAIPGSASPPACPEGRSITDSLTRDTKQVNSFVRTPYERRTHLRLLMTYPDPRAGGVARAVSQRSLRVAQCVRQERSAQGPATRAGAERVAGLVALGVSCRWAREIPTNPARRRLHTERGTGVVSDGSVRGHWPFPEPPQHRASNVAILGGLLSTRCARSVCVRAHLGHSFGHVLNYDASMSRTLVERIHNPQGLTCGCEPNCWCQTTTIGRLLRWYSPARWHHMVSPDHKRARA